MSRMASNYHVGRSTRVCASTGRPLESGEACVTALVHPPGAEEMSRSDYSIEAWGRGDRPPAADLLGFWRTRVPSEGEKRRVLIDDQSLVELFWQMANADEDGASRREEVKFILALILLRKRLLTHEGGDASVMAVRARGQSRAVLGEGLISVTDPRLTDEQIGEVTSRLEAIMSGDPDTVPA